MEQESKTPYMDEMINQEIRKDALSWWRGMSEEAKVQEVVTFKFSGTLSFYRSLPFVAISASDVAIERIYREMVLEESFGI